jgi:sulfite exporter TauE/SafE
VTIFASFLGYFVLGAVVAAVGAVTENPVAFGFGAVAALIAGLALVALAVGA